MRPEVSTSDGGLHCAERVNLAADTRGRGPQLANLPHPEFHRQLAALGFRSYRGYLSSRHWRQTKEAFRASDRPQDCYCCGEWSTQMHHKTYERLGSERLDDLVPLCRRCHNLVHVLERRGDLRTDLVGLLDEVQAKRYAQQQQPIAERARREYERAHLKDEQKQLVRSAEVLIKGWLWHERNDRRDEAITDLLNARDVVLQLAQLMRRSKELETT